MNFLFLKLSFCIQHLLFLLQSFILNLDIFILPLFVLVFFFGVVVVAVGEENGNEFIFIYVFLFYFVIRCVAYSDPVSAENIQEYTGAARGLTGRISCDVFHVLVTSCVSLLLTSLGRQRFFVILDNV